MDTEDTTQPKYTPADMHSLLYPISLDKDQYSNPEWVSGEYDAILQQYPADQWEDAALDVYAKSYDEYKKAAKTDVGTDFLSNPDIPSAGIEEGDDEDTKIAKFEKWRYDAKDTVAKADPVWWHKNRLEAEETIDALSQNEKRKAAGADTGFIRDKVARAGQEALSYSAKLVGAEKDTLRAIDDFFEENPAYDEGMVGQVAGAVGQFASQQSAALAGAAAVGGALAATAGAPFVATAAVAWTGLNALMGFNDSYDEAYQEAYNATGSDSIAADAAMRTAGISQLPEVAFDIAIGKGIVSRFFKAMRPATKSRALSNSIAAAKSASIEGATEAVTEGTQSIIRQAELATLTGKSVDVGQAVNEGIVGGLAGGIAAGGIQTAANVAGRVTGGIPDSTPDADAAREQMQTAVKQRIDSIKQTEQELMDDLQRGPSALKRKTPLSGEAVVDVGAELERFSEGAIDKPFLEYDYLTKDDFGTDVLTDLELVAIPQEGGGVRLYKDTVANRKIIQDARRRERLLNETERDRKAKTRVAQEAERVSQQTPPPAEPDPQTEVAPQPQAEPETTPREQLEEELKQREKEINKTKPEEGKPPIDKEAERKKAVAEIDKRIRGLYPVPILERAPIEKIMKEDIPVELDKLRAALESIPTLDAAKAAIQSIPVMIRELSELSKGYDVRPSARIEILDQTDRLLKQYKNAVDAYNKEARGGKLTKQRKAIENDITRLEDMLLASRGGYRTRRAIGKTPAMAVSNTTGATYSGGIVPELRGYVNSLIAATGMTKPANATGPYPVYTDIFVITQEDAANGILDDIDYIKDVGFDELRELVKRDARNSGKSARGSAITNLMGPVRITGFGGYGIVILKDGTFNELSATVAAHELGHLIDFGMLRTAPTSTLLALRKEYEKARDEAYNKPNAAEAYKHIGNMALLSGPTAYERLSKSKLHRDKRRSGYKYALSDDVGYGEWIANQVALYASDPSLVAVTESQSFIKSMADVFKKLWSTVADFFPKQAPTLRKWLDEHFDRDAFREAIRAEYNLIEKNRRDDPTIEVESVPDAPSDGSEPQITATLAVMDSLEDIGGKTDKGKRSRISERVEATTDSQKIKDQTSGTYYNPLKLNATYKEVRKDITPRNVEAYARKLMDESVLSDVNPAVKSIYQIAVADELERLISLEQDPTVKQYYEELAGSFYENFSLQATRAGQYTSALALLGKLTKRGKRSMMEREIEKTFEKHREDLPDGYKEKIAEIVDKYHESLKNNPDGFIAQDIYRRMHEDLRKALNLPSPTSPFSMYWYGNMLMSPKTLAVNGLGPSIDLVARTAADLVTSPRDVGVVMRAIGKSISSGVTAFQASMRGVDIRAIQSDKYGIKYSNVIPYVRMRNKFLSTPMNTWLKLIATYPFNLMRATDMLIATTAYEMRAHTAAAQVWRDDAKLAGIKLNAHNMARLIDESLGTTPDRIAQYKEQAARDVERNYGDTISRKAKGTYIKLRTMELMDNYRKANEPEIYQEAERYGSVITYNNKPEGSIGAVSDALNAINDKISFTYKGNKIRPLKYTVFPFVNVVANVLSRHLDYSPVGVLRAATGNHLFNKNEQPFSNYERAQRGTIGAASTLLFGGLAMRIAAEMSEADENDERPYMEWTGGGPTSPTVRADWLSKGNEPYSIRIGDHIIRYAEIPGSPLYAAIGGVLDSQRFSNKWDKGTATDNFLSVIQGFAGGMLEMGFLSGIRNIWEIADNKSPSDKVLAPVGTATTGLIPGAGALGFITDVFDPTKVDYRDAKAHFLGRIPYFRSYVSPSLNVFGEKLPSTGRFYDNTSPDPVLKWMADNDVTVPGFVGGSVGSGRGANEKAWMAWAKEKRADLLESKYYGENFTEEETRSIIELSGPRIKERVRALMASEVKYSKTQLQSIVKKIAEEERRYAKYQTVEKSLRTGGEL